MAAAQTQVEKLAELIFALRQKCALKDLYFIERAGISTAEYNCLMQFFGTAAIGMKELSARLDITPGGVTRIVAGLEDKGIVERRIDAEDRRGINVILTRKGERLVRDMQQASLEIHTEIIERIQPSSREAVIEAIEQLIQAINAWLESSEKMESSG